MSDRENFFQAVGELAKMCNATIGPFVLSVYDRALAPYGYERLSNTLGKIIMERGSRDPFPSVLEIKEAMGEAPVTNKTSAIDVANRIWGTIVSHGYTCRPELLAEKIGEIGVYIAKMHGGWSRLCEETDNLKDPTYFKMQLVAEAGAYLEKAAKGKLELPPNFSDEAKALPLNQKALEAIGVAMGQSSHDKTHPQTEGGAVHPLATTAAAHP